MKPNFDLDKWLTINVTSCDSQPLITKTTNLSAPNGPGRGLPFTNDTEIVLSRIEAAHIDLTGNYQDWIKIGFALVNEHGEAGRSYFHRVSRFYSKYSYPECDKQYDTCLKEKNLRTSIKTFYYLAKESGVDISTPTAVASVNPMETPVADTPVTEPMADNLDKDSVVFNTPQLPAEVFTNLPLILRESCALFREGIEQDVFLMSGLGIISACLPNIEGNYFNKALSPHLYLFITGRSAAGKGSMDWSKLFGLTIHNQLSEQSRKEKETFEIEMEQYNNLPRAIKQTAVKPKEPQRHMFFIPANSSSSAFIQALNDNNNRGVVFESEADTLANTAKQEWGNYDDLLRKAFGHESTSMYRRKDKEYMEISNPQLAIVLSGTPKQVYHIMPEVENGLFSRFLYLCLDDKGGFKSPFKSHSQENYIEFFKQKGAVMFNYFNQLQQLDQPITFKLTEDQEERFTASFDHMLTKDRLLVGVDFEANVKRLGIILFRLAMILTALRHLEVELPEQVTTEPVTPSHPLNKRNLQPLFNTLTCSDQDYETAMTIVTTLEKHAISVFHTMPNKELKGKSLNFYEKLPEKFDRQGYLKVAESLGIHAKSAERYIKLFQPKLLSHSHNDYSKITK